ncbi:XdhC family protein [Aureispira anguillae]|uniref:XdhC family protein n=1 Tax=Aureispira anguillae TaxID=2864201 RepID=A0A915YDW6_9BACT|nr:XdhC/CoxI family protein [Aureispira anguillae]BDS11303.1 XdhC family protein [Aureispira anguillae]
MEEQKLWLYVAQKLKEEQGVALMWVPESIGSSPGRQGHQMAVASDATMHGTIGGGVMEYQQVEACKKLLVKGQKECLRKRLIHNPSDKSKWSGLSCSGEQTILIFFLNQRHLNLVQNIIIACQKEASYYLVLRAENTIHLEQVPIDVPRFDYQLKTEDTWHYQYIVGFQETVYLVGAGHVGLALCQQLFLLDFKIVLIDNRAALPTGKYDQFISKKIITSYKKIATFVPSTQYDYIIIMSFSSALDTLILSQLIHKPACYIGMMASQVKVDRIRATLLDKGITKEDFDRVHTPIGLPIKCKTPAEIAVSVAAQIIAIRNIDG